MKLILGFLLIFLSNSFAENKLPNIPEGCFSNKPYCHFSTFERGRDSEGERLVTVYVNFFAHLNIDEFGTIEDIYQVFTNFPAWKKYVAKSKNMRMKESIELPQTVLENGDLIRHHVCDYEMRRPFGWEHVIEKSDYFQIPAYPGAMLSYKFVLDKAYPKTTGIEDKIGTIHVVQDTENNAYNVFVQLEVKPATKILPQVAAEVTERGLVDVFLGMFDLVK